MRLFRLERAVFRLRGGAAAFLKAYSTNTPDKPRSTFVDVHGRIVVAFDQALMPGNEALVVFERRFRERLEAHLGKYLDLTGIALEEEASLRAFFDLDGDYETIGGEVVIPQAAGLLVLTEKQLSAPVTEEEFRFFRLSHGIPVQGIDYDDEMLLNVFDEDRVSYDKGCYLGQEIIARVHYRSRPPKRLAVRAEEDLDPERRSRMTSKTNDPGTGRTLGFVFLETT